MAFLWEPDNIVVKGGSLQQQNQHLPWVDQWCVMSEDRGPKSSQHWSISPVSTKTQLRILKLTNIKEQSTQMNTIAPSSSIKKAKSVWISQTQVQGCNAGNSRGLQLYRRQDLGSSNAGYFFSFRLCLSRSQKRTETLHFTANQIKRAFPHWLGFINDKSYSYLIQVCHYFGILRNKLLINELWDKTHSSKMYWNINKLKCRIYDLIAFTLLTVLRTHLFYIYYTVAYWACHVMVL